MKFKRLATVGLMALLCAGTAMAASQLNAVQVTPTENAATITLRTTGSYAHKEYRPDDHLLLVDLNGVAADAKVERSATLASPVVKSYKLSSYTSASGGEVTRLEFVLGEGVKLDVLDKSDGLQIVMNSGRVAPVPALIAPAQANTAAPSSAASPMPAAKAVVAQAPKNTAPVAKAVSASVAEHPVAHASPVAPSSSLTPTVIRNITVERGRGAVDIIIEGPSAAQPFMLQHPDRLVVDFTNAVVRASVKNIDVHDKDVHEVRVGRFQAEPPVTRIVIDLSGPHGYDVLTSDKQVTVRVKTEGAALLAAPQNASTTPMVVTVSAGPAMHGSNPPAIVSGITPAIRPAPVAAAKPPAETAPKPTMAPEVASAASAPIPPSVLVSAKAPASAREIAPTATFPAMVTAAPEASVEPVSSAVPPAQNVQATLTPISTKPQHEREEASLPEKVLDLHDPAVRASVAAETVAAAPPQVDQPTVESARMISPAPEEPVAKVTPVAATPVVIPAAAVTVAPIVAAAAPVAQPPVVAAAPAPVAVAAVAPAPVAPVAGPTPQIPASVTAGASTPQAPGTSVTASAPKYTGEPISVNLKDVDLKDFFRLIHEISGLNIVLDPNVHGTVTLVLDDVPWDQALDIVLKNNALDRELQGNVLRIAATDTLRKEAVDRRAQSEAVALAVDRQTITRFLSYAKAKEVVGTIKKFLTARGDVISDERTNALIISDIPSVLPTLDRLISQMDKKTQQVEIEVRVVSATRSFSRDLGVQLGFNWGNGVTSFGGSNPNGSTATTTTTTTSTGTTTSPIVPLFTSFAASGATTGFSISNVTASYGIDAVLTAAESHNLAKVLSRPRIVTQSNIKAEVKQGVKIPVYTSGTANANASVSYVDAVLRLSVIPQITADNTIFMTVDVENTQPSGTINSNYILTTQQATTQVLVTDGGTVVIGGVIQTSNTVSSTQTPILGNIPWLGNLFKERSVSTSTEELIFFITPKIIQT